jgi:hypothetical protein
MQKEIIQGQDPEGNLWIYERKKTEDCRKYHKE